MKFGIDLGGTKIEGVVLDERGEVIERRRIPTEREKGYDHILQGIARVVSEMEEVTGLTAEHVGIGTPGTIDPISGLMKNSNTVVLNGKPLGKDLEKLIDKPLTLANDANCFAVAETLMGCVPEAAPDAKVVFGVILGTGTGGGVVVNGKIIAGAQGIGGEWGHTFLDHSGGYCYCGRVGCTEQIISGPALERYYLRMSGRALTMREIVPRYRAGSDAAATRTLERFFHYFAKGIANIINFLDPDVVVLGGGLGNIGELYEDGIPQVVDHLFNPRMDTRFLKPKLGDSAGVFGAALL
ncbi:putative NBD/HSP70 family sugar kinase [Lewinella marina]|uniref:Sugar kinase n=1 Tax=Neolewinella marina TaxID=438751 RepID=A0A2G0CBA2_9BACT|nr:ROK family protein [Neolewinella marina]NJB87773.1 putative NBD/HSP70 family sugar kinase [Neolewinella marina]PHK97244.1 sugar kinase [Neolewinella marina]